MSTGDSYEDVRELAQDVAATDDLSEFDWGSLLYSRHSSTSISFRGVLARLVGGGDMHLSELRA